MIDVVALLLQAGDTGDPTGIGLARFFMGFFLIIFIFGTFLGFTYWISKDE